MQIILNMVRHERDVTRLVFGPGEYLIGRSPECQVRIGLNNKQGVSRKHCLLSVTEHVATIRDLGSLNGTVVNRERISQERKLKLGDRILIGNILVRVESPGIDGIDKAMLCHGFSEDHEETIIGPDCRTMIGDTQA